MSEEITFDDIEFGEPIEEREPDYRDGYIRGIYRAKNIIDSKQKEIERLNNIINELEDLIVIKLQRDYHEHNYRINTGDLEEIYDKLQELKGSDKE